MKLYEISERYRTCLDRVALSDGEISPEIEAELDSISTDLRQKVDAICKFEAESAAWVNSAKHEIKRLQTLCSQKEKSSERLSEYILYHMRLSGLRNIETPTHKVSIVNGPPKVELDIDRTSVPMEYLRTITEIDKEKIRQGIRHGDVRWAHLSRREVLRVR